MDANTEASLQRQVASIADGVFNNQRAIERNHKESREESAEMLAVLMEIKRAVYGNGKPQDGLSYRVAWLERLIVLLIIAAVIELAALIVMAVILANHIAA